MGVMPKEVVRARPELDDGTGAYIRVGWSKESDTVELATAVPDGQGRLMVPDRGPTAAPDAWGVVIHDGEDVGWFVQLDRNGINRLIRSLRKARDQAFGEDA